MNKIVIVLIALIVAACGEQNRDSSHAEPDHADAPAKGPNQGRLLSDGAFAVELAIFETGVPPEYHAWPTLDGKLVPLDQVELTVELERLGGKIDRFAFAPQGDFLRGNGVVAEPHSFVVKIQAKHANKTYNWNYDSFEGRTRIPADVAQIAGVVTEIAGPATLVETIQLHGRVVADPSRQRAVTARYPGVIRDVNKRIGDRVAAGDVLATVESDESLQTYNVIAPIAGTIVARDANPGEHSGTRVLFTIIDASRVVAELAAFPRDRARVKQGAAVQVRMVDSGATVSGKVERIDAHAGENQTVIVRVPLDNRSGELVAGSFVTGDVAIAERNVPLAVKTSGLQPFRDFTVVYEQVGDEYEVRMLELGEQRGEWTEVLGGIEAGARYVTTNSFLIKADIEKSGASHDH